MTDRTAEGYPASWTICPLTRENCTIKCEWSYMKDVAGGKEPSCKMLHLLEDIDANLDSMSYGGLA